MCMSVCASVCMWVGVWFAGEFNLAFFSSAGVLPVQALIDNFDASWDVSHFIVSSPPPPPPPPVSKIVSAPYLFCYYFLKFIYLFIYFFFFDQFVCNQGNLFTLKTDCEASRYRLVNIDITCPEKVSKNCC